MTPARDAIVATAGESIARGSRSFAAASRLFDRATRERAWLLYAWCRACDDLVDGQDHGHGGAAVPDAAARLDAIRVRTAAALEGFRACSGLFPGEAVGGDGKLFPRRPILQVAAFEDGILHMGGNHLQVFVVESEKLQCHSIRPAQEMAARMRAALCLSDRT